MQIWTMVPLGGNFRTDKVARIHKDLDLVWTDTFTLLGVTFDSRMEKMSSNYDERYNKVEDLIVKWKKMLLTQSGRLMIAKCIVLSQYIYLFQTIEISEKCWRKYSYK